MVTINFEPTLNRSCGTCTMCCTLVPVKELLKPANTRCEHQFSRGCRIYAKRPLSCRMWNCAWLTDPTTLHLRRPNHSRYVIDTVPDFPLATNEVTGESWRIQFTQIWVDPKMPDEWRKDRQLKEWINASKRPAIFRRGNLSAVSVVPPSVSREKEWIEKEVTLTRPPEDEWAIERN